MGLGGPGTGGEHETDGMLVVSLRGISCQGLINGCTGRKKKKLTILVSFGGNKKFEFCPSWSCLGL